MSRATWLTKRLEKNPDLGCAPRTATDRHYIHAQDAGHTRGDAAMHATARAVSCRRCEYGILRNRSDSLPAVVTHRLYSCLIRWSLCSMMTGIGVRSAR